MLELRRLLVLHELDRLGTLARSRALSYSPSAVSQQLAQLEREVGTALTEPVGRGVRLTDAAAVLVTHTRAAIAELERAEAEIASSGRVSGTLRIGAFQTVLLSILPEVIAVPPSGPWSAVKGLADLAEARWALDPERTAPGRWARDACRRLGFEPDVRFDGTDLLAHVHLVRSGMAVAVLPGLLGAEYTRGIRLVELRGKPTRRLFTLARTSRAGHPAVIEFRDVLRQEFAGSG